MANATAQQHAAVHTLFHNLANGPLFGGSAVGAVDTGANDAVGQIKALQAGSNQDVIEGVSFKDVKQMILDLTAPPAEIGHELPPAAAVADDNTAASAGLGSGLAGGAAAPSFMQASEISSNNNNNNNSGAKNLAPPTAADDAKHERALEPTPLGTPEFGSVPPEINTSAGAAGGIQSKGSGAPGIATPAHFEPQTEQTGAGAGAAPQQSGWDTQQLTQGSVPAGNTAWSEVSFLAFSPSHLLCRAWHQQEALLCASYEDVQRHERRKTPRADAPLPF